MPLCSSITHTYTYLDASQLSFSPMAISTNYKLNLCQNINLNSPYQSSLSNPSTYPHIFINYNYSPPHSESTYNNHFPFQNSPI